MRVLSPSCPDVRRGTRCSLSGSCRRAAPLSGAFRRCSPADSPVGALDHRGAPLAAPPRLQRHRKGPRGQDPLLIPVLNAILLVEFVVIVDADDVVQLLEGKQE